MDKILLIEDDISFADELAYLLRVWGHDVDEVRNPSAAKRLLEQGSYQVIISDESFKASWMLGSQFIVRNIHLMRNAKIILLTGRSYLPFVHPDVTILYKGDPRLIEALQGVMGS